MMGWIGNKLSGGVISCLLVLLLCVGGAWAVTDDKGLLARELAYARENLRVILATRDRVAASVLALRQSGRTPPDTLADYDLYLKRLNEMVAENRKLVAQLEALQMQPAGLPGTPPSDDTDGVPRVSMPPQTAGGAPAGVDDPVAALDRELDESLAAYDGMLRKEVELIRTRSARRMRDLSDEAEDAVRRLKEKGIDLEMEGDSAGDPGTGDPAGRKGERRSGSENGEGQGEDPGERDGPEGTGRSADSGEGEAGGETASRERSGDGPGGEKSGRRSRYESGADDDIVARQLREAAEKETDPVLKEKLWKEYDDYKNSQR